MTTPKATNSSEHRPFRWHRPQRVRHRVHHLQRLHDEVGCERPSYWPSHLHLRRVRAAALSAGGLQAMRIDSLRLQFWLAVLLVLPIFLFLYALCQLPLSIATIIFFTNPLFVCLLAPIWLGERITWL